MHLYACMYMQSNLLSSIHFNSSTVHFTSVHFYKVTCCEPSDGVKKWISRWSYWRSPCKHLQRSRCSRVFYDSCAWCQPFHEPVCCFSDDSLESLASEYWTAAWFIYCRRGFSAAPEPLQRLPDPSGVQTPHVGPVSSPNGHPFPWAPAHTHTRGQNKALPASPRYLFFFLLTQSKCLSALFCGRNESADSGWLTLHIKRPLGDGPPTRHSSTQRRDFAMRLCPLTHSASPGALAFPALPLRPSVSRPIHSSRGPETLLSVYCRITAFVCFKCDSCFIHLPSVEAMR